MRQTCVLALCLPLALAGCIDPMPPGADPVDACGASGFQYLVGRPGVLLDGMRFSQDVRVIQPDMAVTMDFQAGRLNFWLDRRDVIERVTCG